MNKPYLVRDPQVKEFVLMCMLKRLTTNESLQFLKEKGYEMHERTLRNIKKKIRNNRFKELQEIFVNEVIDQHLDSIKIINDQLKIMYQQQEIETDPSKKTDIGIAIINLLPMRSEYYYNTTRIISKDKLKEYETKISIQTDDSTIQN